MLFAVIVMREHVFNFLKMFEPFPLNVKTFFGSGDQVYKQVQKKNQKPPPLDAKKALIKNTGCHSPTRQSMTNELLRGQVKRSQKLSPSGRISGRRNGSR